MIKKYFTKEHVITKEDNEDFESSTKCWICHNDYIDTDLKELGKFNLKINIIPKGLEKYMSFTLNNKLSFIDSFQFLNSSLGNLVKNLGKDNLKHLSLEFDNSFSNLVKQKWFCPYYEYTRDFEKFIEQIPSKEEFYSSLTELIPKELVTKKINMFLRFGTNLK